MIQVKHFYSENLIADAVYLALRHTRRHGMSGWPTIGDTKMDHGVTMAIALPLHCKVKVFSPLELASKLWGGNWYLVNM